MVSQRRVLNQVIIRPTRGAQDPRHDAHGACDRAPGIIGEGCATLFERGEARSTRTSSNTETERLIDSANQDAGEQQLINSRANSLGF